MALAGPRRQIQLPPALRWCPVLPPSRSQDSWGLVREGGVELPGARPQQMGGRGAGPSHACPGEASSPGQLTGEAELAGGRRLPLAPRAPAQVGTEICSRTAGFVCGLPGSNTHLLVCIPAFWFAHPPSDLLAHPRVWCFQGPGSAALSQNHPPPCAELC